MNSIHRWLCHGAVAMAACGVAGAAAAQGYPAKPIRFVITYPTGGGSDYTVRPIAQKLSERWGQPVVVESRPGGSAMIGTDFVVRSAPDGYTLLLSASSEVSMNVVLFKKMPYDPVRDLQPVTLVGHKQVRDDPGFDLWSDTSTLYTRLLAGDVAPVWDALTTVASIAEAVTRAFRAAM